MAPHENPLPKSISLNLSQKRVREEPFLALRELVPWLRKKRWFMDKEAAIAGVEQADAVVLVPGPDLVVHGLFITFRLAGVVEHCKRCFIPIILSSISNEDTDISNEDTVRLELTDGALYLALAEHSKLYQEPWLRSLTAGTSLGTQHGGCIRFQALTSLSNMLTGEFSASQLDVSTSNILTLVATGSGKWVSKTYKDLRGPSGEAGRKWLANYEALRYEALALAGYPNIPKLLGLVHYEAPDKTVAALGVVMDWVEQEDKAGSIFWNALDRYVTAWISGQAPQDEAFHQKHRQGVAAAAREIARTIAGLHRGFLSSKLESFRPVVASHEEVRGWAETPLREVGEALRVLHERRAAHADKGLTLLVQQLKQRVPHDVLSAPDGTKGVLGQLTHMLHACGEGLMKAQIHGDLSTDQGLIAAGRGGRALDTFLDAMEHGDADCVQQAARELAERVRWVDFEGVPAKNLVDESEDGRGSLFLDLAGIAQGFWYIANIQLYARLGLDPEHRLEDRDKARCASLVLAGEMTVEAAAIPGLTAGLVETINGWLAEVTAAFFDGYLHAAEEQGIGTSILASWHRNHAKALFDFWILARAAHELRYETYARDWGWEGIPGGRFLQILRMYNASVLT